MKTMNMEGGQKHTKEAGLKPTKHLETPHREIFVYDPNSVSGHLHDFWLEYNDTLNALESGDPGRMAEAVADQRMMKMHFKTLLEEVRSIESRAKFDFLTGLSNRADFMEKANAEVSRVHRFEKNVEKKIGHVAGPDEYVPKIFVLFIDLDKFKSVNDKLGHEAGDIYLKTVAHEMRSVLHRPTDVLARLGGDEFAVVLSDVEEQDARLLAEKLIAAVDRGSERAKEECSKKYQEIYPAADHNVSASIGFAALRKGETHEKLIERADAAMYEAKRGGRHTIKSYEEMFPNDEDGSDGEDGERTIRAIK